MSLPAIRAQTFAFLLATPVGAQVLPGASRDFGPIAVSAGYADSGRAITFDTMNSVIARART